MSLQVSEKKDEADGKRVYVVRGKYSNVAFDTRVVRIRMQQAQQFTKAVYAPRVFDAKGPHAPHDSLGRFAMCSVATLDRTL
jgi:hypothetical protein